MEMSNAISDVSSRAVNAPGSEPKKNVERIDYATGQSVLGTVLVARSRDGVCAIIIGSDMKDDLAIRFNKSRFTQDDQKLRDDLKKVIRFIEAPTRSLDLTLDIRGTHFQKRVWTALCAVPSGSTITYAALAARIGEPKAVRAVANACAANAIALAIPCHRVIRKDGTFSGYRWGEQGRRSYEFSWRRYVCSRCIRS
jgi:O-6-methylguanine DNA methyltransferase